MSSRPNYSLTQLEYVLAIHKTGSFARAAELCHVTQPTLSMQVQKLETELGGAIFDRSKKPLLLTDLGKKLIKQIQSVVREARVLHEMAASCSGTHASGTLRLGVIPTIAPYLIPNLLPTIEKHHSGLQLEITEMQTHQIINALDNDELDVGLLAVPLGKSQLHEIALYHEPFWVLVRNDSPVARKKQISHKDLDPQSIWLLTEGHCLREQVLDICAFKKTKNTKSFTFESGSLETLKNIIESYGGYTLVPQLATSNYGKNCRLLPFERPIPARMVGLVHRRKEHKAPLIEKLSEAILDSIPGDIRNLRQKHLDVIPVE